MPSVYVVPRPRLAPGAWTVDRAREHGLLLRKWRRDKGLKRPEVLDELKKLGIEMSYGYLAKLESGVRALAAASVEYREGLRQVYRLSREEWERETGLHVPQDEVKVDTDDLRSGTRTIPVYDLLSAGAGVDGGTVIDVVDIPVAWEGHYAAYEVVGDSMAPHIPEGARIVIRVQDYANPGDEIVAWVPDIGMVVKVFDRVTPEGEVVLASYNPEYRPIWASEARIYGVVVEVRLRRKRYRNGKHGPN